jgi:hypothetical protein
MKMTQRKRIFWNDAERKAVFNRMVELYAGGRYSTRENMLIKAQDILPPSRRRKVYPAMLSNLKVWMNNAEIESQTKARDRKLTEVALAAKVETPTPAPQPVELGVSELLEKLFDQLAKRVATEVMSGISEQLSALQKTHQDPRPVIVNQTAPGGWPQTTKPRRKRVMVIGLKGQQMSVVKQKYQDIDFTFMDAEEALCRSPGGADFTILMTKFINHSVHSKYRDVTNLKYCNGGVSELSSIMYVIRNTL